MSIPGVFAVVGGLLIAGSQLVRLTLRPLRLPAAPSLRPPEVRIAIMRQVP